MWHLPGSKPNKPTEPSQPSPPAEHRYYVRRDPGGACYVIDRRTALSVYGTYHDLDAQKWCDRLNADDAATGHRDRAHDLSTGDIYTIPYRGRWANMVKGQPQVVNTATSQGEAEALGREFADLIGVKHRPYNREAPAKVHPPTA